MKQKKKLLLTACVGGALSVIWLAVSLFSREPLTSLIRPENGEGDRKEKLEVWIGEEPYSIEVTVRERPKTEAETAEELQKAEDGMELLFLGENQDLEHITEKVNMPSVYPGTDIAIQWYLNSWEYISVDGTVKNEGFTRAEQVEVTAVLSLEDQTVSWDRTVWVCPLENPDNKALIRILSGKMEDTQKDLEGQQNNLDQAKQNMEQAKYDFCNFSKELDDVNMACNLNIDTGDFLSFADYFFDGFVVDWMVQDRINTARRQVDEAIRRTEYIINQLQHM